MWWWLWRVLFYWIRRRGLLLPYWLTLRQRRWRRRFSPNCPITFTRLHCASSQKILFFSTVYQMRDRSGVTSYWNRDTDPIRYLITQFVLARLWNLYLPRKGKLPPSWWFVFDWLVDPETEAIYSETPFDFHWIIWCYISEDRILHTHCYGGY